MANIGFIEARQGERWRAVSELFAAWIQANNAAKNCGWSEDDSVRLPDGRELFAFAIPSQHDPSLFARWAEATSRLYGFAEQGTIRCPREPNLSFDLPTLPDVPMPAWLR
ncbi:hypothetical protein GN316_15245 [Xylophilus sp. Kf1]|nr:hypothetical protein [Xylophilus sp. Kf1]